MAEGQGGTDGRRASDRVSEDTFRASIRLEASELDPHRATALVAEDLQPDHVARALAHIRQRDTGKRGRLGERVARVRERKLRIPSLTHTAAYRIPDVLTDSELIEVKNTARLRLTSQLRDFVLFTEQSGRTFVLVTRFDTRLSAELVQLIDSGRIVHRHLRGLLSPTGRRLVRRLIEDALAGVETSP